MSSTTSTRPRGHARAPARSIGDVAGREQRRLQAPRVGSAWRCSRPCPRRGTPRGRRPSRSRSSPRSAGRRPASAARIRRVASSPSSSGIWTSISTTSYARRSSAAIASSPLSATSAAIAHPLQQAERELLVHGVVLGEQDAERVTGGEVRVDRRGAVDRTGTVATPARRGPSASASCSADGLTGLTSNAATFASLAGRVRRVDDRMTTGGRRAGRRSRGAPSPGSTPSMLGHEHVEDGEVERAARRDTQRERLARRRRSPATVDAPALEQRRRRSGGWWRCRRRRGPGSRARLATSGAGRRRRRGSVRRRTGRSSRKVLPSPAMPVLVGGQRAAHRLGEPAADREAEARPAVPPRDRRVGLAERLEQPVHPVRRDADAGVADLDRRSSTGPRRRASAPASPSTDSTTSPCSVNLTAFDSRLRTIWRSRPGVADDRRRAGRRPIA